MQLRTAIGPDTSRLSRLLAIGWTALAAAVYLSCYDAWLIPLQWAHWAAATIPTLTPGPQFGGFVVRCLWDLLGITAITATAFALGAILISRLVSERNLLAAVFALGLGFWVLAAAVLIVGAFSVGKVPWLFCGLAAWVLPAPRRFFRRPTPAAERLDGWAKLMIVFLIVAALLNLPGALVPPFEYDELEYHLGALAEYHRAGHIVFLPHNFYSNLPQLTEMLYLLALTATSDIAAKLLHWSFGVWAAVAVFAVASRLWSRNIGLSAAALFYCVPFVQDLSQTARIDLATTFFAVLAFGGLLVWRKTGRPSGESGAGSGDLRTTEVAQERAHHNGWLWLSALAAGSAVATKWPAVAVVLLPALVFVLAVRRSLLLVAGYWLLAALCVLPWVVKNWLLAGNPVYPLLWRLFPSAQWGAPQAELFAEKHAPQFGWAGWSQLGERAWHYSFAEPMAVPVLLLTAPLILLVRPADRSARRAGGLFVAAYAGWFLFTFRPWRFLFPAFPLAAMLGACALGYLMRDRLSRWLVGWPLAIVFGLGLALMGLGVWVDAEDPEQMPPKLSILQYILGQCSRDDMIERMGNGVYEPIVWMNRHLPADAKVLYVGEARAYYSRQPVVYSTAFDRHPLTRWSHEAADVPALRRLLRQQGITHVYVNFSELERLRAGYRYLLYADWGKIRNLLQEDAREIHRFGRSIVYELDR